MSWYRETRGKIYQGFRFLVSPLVKALVRVDMPPAAVSVAGLLFTVIAFVLMYRGSTAGLGWMRASGAVILFAAAWDTVDGEVARARGKSSPKGAFLDSILDRVSEFVVLLGMLLFFDLGKLDTALVFALLFASYSISYIRARAEGVGIECTVGVFDRATRVVLIGAALIIIPQYINWVLRALLAGTTFTAVRRFIHVLASGKKS
ncbi:CDP-alcohol phosphatidyltransferase family protein [candidate division WOR-3 bacterium]|nr:CDP-alcohol phosphatidyltransferase family protein [candidate division WOR-3 bacterium]